GVVELHPAGMIILAATQSKTSPGSAPGAAGECSELAPLAVEEPEERRKELILGLLRRWLPLVVGRVSPLRLSGRDRLAIGLLRRELPVARHARRLSLLLAPRLTFPAAVPVAAGLPVPPVPLVAGLPVEPVAVATGMLLGPVAIVTGLPVE